MILVGQQGNCSFLFICALAKYCVCKYLFTLISKDFPTSFFFHPDTPLFYMCIFGHLQAIQDSNLSCSP
mgnify:CR=1 FL=1|jgi:hypothetical protein